MKFKQLNTLIISFVFLFLTSLSSSAQTFYGTRADELVKGSSEVRIDENRKSISFVRNSETAFLQASDAISWLQQSVFKSRPEDGLMLLKTEPDKSGFIHFRYRQLYRNIPVEYSMYIVHTRDGKIISANGEYYPGINTISQPSITSAEALKIAKKNIGAEIYKTDAAVISPPELVIFKTDEGFRLAYKTDVYGEKPLSRNWIYIDAISGKILKKVNRIETIDVSGTAVTRYSGTQTIRTDSVSAASYRLRESARGTGNGIITRNLQHGSSYPGAVDFVNTTNVWSFAYDNAAMDAHFGAEKTYDHYYTSYGYNSFDNLGGTILSYVHYSTNYVNAFWDGTQMTYGDGDGFQYTPLTSLEIVGHEITHGVTELSAGLVYAGESGALNESFSDIMGNTIRFKYDPAFATWFCGDQIIIPGSGGTPIRNLANPNDFECADTYGGTYWHFGDIVHYDSGVQNFWYYLLTVGGSGVNDLGNPYTINGIGLTDANAIAFRNLTVYLTPNSTFADARTYAIQAATDLFGSCSDQVIQTTNAWYAVGVGGIFSNAVIASFAATQNYFCVSPASVFFTNSSTNATSYKWDFGDGDTSTAASPSHVYISPGAYTVRLIASGAAACGNTDTTTILNYITVTNTGGPVSPACTPVTQANCCGIGITRVQLNTINNVSGSATEGYKDFTCAAATTLTAGDSYPLTVTTGFSNNENVKGWIDYNNDGAFNNSNELVFISNNHFVTHTGTVHTPVTAVLNTPLRMRMIDDGPLNVISSSCYNPQIGQAEDYSITFIANTLPPVANFVASDTIINAGDTVFFSDLTVHAPTSWSWTFQGGTSSNATSQNPSAIYSAVGDYTVTLHVANAFGSDSITKTMYIHVVNYVYMCASSTTSGTNGLLFDSGGPLANYQNGENCTLLISPSCAASITLSFSALQMEGCCDLLTVYDGASTAAPLLLSATGSSVPATVTANSGQMFIRFSSDGSVTYSGFAAAWSSVIASSAAPVASFAISDSTPALTAPVQFTDQSTNSPVAWQWNFGDGNTSTQQNPSHPYANPGTYNVRLIAFTCSQSDTIIKTVVVQPPPSVTTNPSSLNASVSCGDSVTVALTVYNSGPGDLIYSLEGTGTGTVEVLAFTYGSDTTEEYPHTLAALNQYYTNYTLTRYYGTTATDLQSALTGKDVLLFIEQEMASSTVYSTLATTVQNFVSSGGTVIVCGSWNTYATRIFDMGLFIGSTGGTSSSTLSTLDTTDVITDNVPLSFAAPNATFPVSIANADKVKLVQPTGSTTDVVTYRHIGSGTVIYLGFDYYAYTNPVARLLANAVSLPHSSLESWVSASPESGTVTAGDSSVIMVTFSTNGLFAGVHTTSIVLNTNDPLHPSITVPCTLTVAGSPAITLSQPCVNFGSTMQFTTLSDTFNITNSGCDTLHVTSLVPSLAEYTVTPTGNIHIPPYQSSMVIVHFSPATVGTFNGNLAIHNNDVDTMVCFTGAGTGSPVIDVDPDSFNVTLFSGDSTTRPLTISNLGLGDLHYTVHGNGSGITGDTAVLVIQESDAWSVYMNTFLQTNFGITPTVITSSQIAATDFMQFDVVITVGDQSTAYYNNISANVAKFQAFAEAGGVVQYQMATQGGTNVNLAGGAIIMYGNAQSQNTGLILSHPILNGISNPLMGSSANHCYVTSLPVDAQVITQTSTLSLPTTVEYPVGYGLVVATGMTWEYLYTSAFNTAPMLPNSMAYVFSKIGGLPHWLSLSSTTDTVVPAGSSIIDVRFNATGLNGGVYTSSLKIASNDPATPEIIVPCTLNVIGVPGIALSDTSFDFGNVFVGGNKKDTLIVVNTGSDLLTVSNIISGDAAFTVNTTDFSVAPGDSQKVVITFSPTAIAAYATILTLINNDNDTIVFLRGNGIAAPSMQIIPASFDVTLSSCDDSITLPVQIINSGGSNLDYVIDGAGGGSLQVLALTYGTDIFTEYPNTISAIDQYFTNYTLNTINTTSASALQAALAGKDVFLMTEPENGTPSVYAGFATVLQNFVANGGTAILCGALGSQSSCIFNTGLFSGSYGMQGSFNTLNVINNSTPVTNGVASSFSAPDATFCLNITNANKVKLVDLSGFDVVTYRSIGSGKAIFLAFDYFAYSNNEALLISNSIQWVASNQLANWIHLSTGSGTVAAGDTALTYVTFTSGNLTGGTYYTNMIVHSNDPLHPADTIPCTLHVSSAPCADISYTTSLCSGIVNFASTVVNGATSYAWTFGDGGTSATATPSHVYAAGGSYNIRLIACNAAGCDTVNTTLNLSSIGGPVAASCSPQTTANCCGIGIQNVTFNTINNTTADGSDGYQDYTCFDTTSVMRGQTYSISVQTGSIHNENVQVWIDYNNNGIFASGELVFSSLNSLSTHIGSVTIPNTGVVLNTPLRMRVGSDYYNLPVPAPCVPVEYGQYEDYTVSVTFGVDVPEIPAGGSLSIYPNPFTGESSIEYTLENSKKVSLAVYNAIGEKILVILSAHEQSAGNYKYKLKVAEAGIYLVVLTTDDGSAIRRVIKMD